MVIALLAAFWIVLIVALAYFHHRGDLRNVTLLPYQRGVLFVRGLPGRDVGPGKHRVWVGSEFLVSIDTRPVAVHAQNQAVALQDGAAAVYGVSASAEVKDARKAIYSARNYNHVPAYLLLSSVRKILNSKSSSALVSGRELVEKAVAEVVTPRLAAAGFALSSFRFSQLSVIPSQERPAFEKVKTPEKERLPN